MNSRKNIRSFGSGVASVLIIAVAILMVWDFVVSHWQLPPAILPSPRNCLDAAIKHRDDLIRGTIGTGAAAVAGLITAVAIGSLLAALLSQSKLLRAAIYPYIIFLQTVPIVAIAPLLIIWSGYTFRSVLIVTVIVCLFPIINSVTSGLTRIDRDMTELFDLYGVGRFKRLRKLQIPSAISDLMVGTKTSAGLAVIGAIVAEFFVGNGIPSYDGLGTLMTGWQALTKTDALIAALFFSAGLGLALFVSVQGISRYVLARWTAID